MPTSLPSIPKLDGTPELPTIDEAPLVEETIGPSLGTSTLPLVDDIDAWVEVCNVKDLVTFGVPLRKLEGGSTRVMEIKITMQDVDLTRKYIGTIDKIPGVKMVTNIDEKKQKEGDIILEPMVTKVTTPEMFRGHKLIERERTRQCSFSK